MSVAAAIDLQGHRGARGLLPENTIPGFLLALDLGVTTLELDLVVSADGHLVVSHDPWFSAKICSLPSGEPVPADAEREHRIYGMPYAEVIRYDCGRRGHPRFPEQRPMPAVKPLLVDVVAAAEAHARARGLPPVAYNIETKSTPAGDDLFHPAPEPFVRLLLDALDRLGIASRTTLQSFDVRTLQVARRLAPALPLSLLVEAAGFPGLGVALALLGFVPAVFSPEYALVDEALVREVHRRDMRLLPWTVNDPVDMRRLLALGVDGFITDYPDRGARLLGRQEK